MYTTRVAGKIGDKPEIEINKLEQALCLFFRHNIGPFHHSLNLIRVRKYASGAKNVSEEVEFLLEKETLLCLCDKFVFLQRT